MRAYFYWLRICRETKLPKLDNSHETAEKRAIAIWQHIATFPICVFNIVKGCWFFLISFWSKKHILPM